MYQFEKVPKVEGHKCWLPQEEELIDMYIYGGILVDLRRRFRQYLMVSPSNPETKSVLKSSAQIRMEGARHLLNYYYMIHPFSEGRMTWETIMIVVYCGLFFLMPLEMALPLTKPLLLYIKFFCDVMCFIDIVLFFCTGYYNVQSRRVIMSPKKVFVHYLFTYFLFDVVSSCPYNMYIMYAERHQMFQLKYLFVFKFVRLPTLISYIRKFCIRLRIWSYKLTRLNFFICLTIIIWWSTAVTFQILVYINGFTLTYFRENPDLFTPMMDSCFQVVRAFMLVATSEIYTETILSMVFNLCCLLMGSVLNMIILGQVLQIYESRSGSRNKYDNLIQQIGEYMKYKELPTSLKNKVFRYVEFKFQKNIFKEGDILLSKLLKKDVVLHNCRRLVERVDFFKGLPDTLILRIITKLRSEIYLPNDVIVQAGVPGNAMYFIYVGTVAVYTTTRKEICHLEDGSNFGEISLVINEPRVATVIAVTDCEVFRLSRKDFLEALEPYPSLYNKIKMSALSRLKKTRLVMNQDLVADDENEKVY